MSLFQHLQQHLTQKREIPFVEFMQLALYEPQLGYYSSGLTKIGAQGDFITGPELSPLFGYTLANQCQQILSMVPSPNILEFGAGTGALCVTLLEQLERVNCLPEHYFILELSAHLRHGQQELVQQRIPHLAEKIHWLEQWPNESFNGVIIANEVLDAMPIHRFKWVENKVLESYVRIDAQGQLSEHFLPTTNARLLTYLQDKLPSLGSPYLSEVNLFIDDWIKELYQLLNQGLVLLIDYGFPRHEYYHPDRNQGTLMCHYQHHAHTNPLIHVGEQDITAHVDFTHVAEAGQNAGFHVAGYTNQGSFLLANGLLHFVNSIKEEHAAFRAKQAAKQLIQENEMGELFKVIALTKNLAIPLTGFLLNDKRVSL
ncbi:class I SAM-dependent methyltransferase [Legionella sp. km772]|uniref:class I SAM-dependent methyltransferase n=1 Tax=Legionella sp. km772 TaxID=2498111 RepID=UPI000F8CE8D3|nr:SAM-dependent methyltransferase [Legionella sp. km772]RUR13107.1 SAM-dependent methyltransferase [Legionella sp. km772]